MLAHYRTAQVCLNGHSTTSDIQLSPELMARFCPECGEQTITQCPSCQKDIRGWYHVEGVISIRDYVPPRYCYDCGKPFPWTSRALEAARELTDEIDELTPDEKKTLKQAIADLSTDSAKTGLAATRYKKILGKIGKVAADALTKIVIEVATEGAKKSLGF